MTSHFSSSKSAPCFAEGCVVLMAYGRQKPVESIMKGDIIVSGSGEVQEIECVIQTTIQNG